MKNLLKKVALLLSLCMMFTLVPTTVFAEGTEVNVSDVASFKNAVTDSTTTKIILDANIDMGDSYVVVSKALTLELNDCEITSNNSSAYATITVGTEGNLTINATNGGAISNTLSDAVGNFGTLTINGGTFTGYYAVYNYANANGTPIAVINGGTFNGIDGDYAVVNSADMTVEAGTINGGLCSGDKLAVNGGTIDLIDVEDGTSCVITGGTIAETNTVAKIGDNSYSTLAAAIEAAEDNNVITLVADVDMGDSYVVVSKALTLDLNGYEITSNNSSVYATITVGTEGNLTINATNGGAISNTLSDAVGNFGTLTINGGTFTGYYAVYNYANANGTPIAVINGGAFNGIDGDYAVVNSADMTVEAGTINGGLCSGDKLAVNGGKIDLIDVEDDTSCVITGGTFGQDPSAYVAEGYEATEDENGDFVVAEKTEDPVTTPTHEHSFCGWYTVKAPNCFNAGYEARMCACGATESRPLAATSHNYDVNGVCAICHLTKEAVATGTAPSRTNPNTGVHF